MKKLTLLLALVGLLTPGLRAHAALPKVGITGVTGGAHWVWVEAENYSAINGGGASYNYDATGVTSGMFDPNPSGYRNVVFQAWPASPPPWVEWNIHIPAAMAAPTILLNYSYAGSSTPGGSVQIDGSSVGTYSAGTGWVRSGTLSAITGGDHTLRLQQNFVYSEPYLDGILLYDGNLTAAGRPTPTSIVNVSPTWMQANHANLGPVVTGPVTPQFSVRGAPGTNYYITKDGVTSVFTPGTTLTQRGLYRVWAVAEGSSGPQERIMAGVDFKLLTDGGADTGTVYYSANFEPASQGAAFAAGPVNAQGAPAWAGYFASGYDEAGTVAGGVSHNGGGQAMRVSGYRSSVLTLPGRISDPLWFEFAFRPNFTPGTPGTTWALTTRGEKSDVQGIKMGLEWDGTNGVVRVGSIGAGFAGPGTAVGSFTNGQWQTISFAAALGQSTYEVYLGGNYATTMTVSSGYEGIRTLVFSSATQSWNNTGDWYVDGIRLASRPLYATTGSTFPWSTGNPAYPVTEIGPGLLHSKFTVMSPRRMALNAVRVDMAHPQIRFHTTGRHASWGQPMPDYPSMTVRTRRQTTRDFLSTSRAAGMNMVVAVNAAPWEPWVSPYNHQYADKLGLAVSNGVLVCDGKSSPSLIVHDDLSLQMRATPAGTDISDILHAVSGFEFVLFNGVINGINDTANLNPRTAFGVSADGRYLVILTIDGRRTGHSDGATHYDLGKWLRDCGSWSGINMDGGGSTTLFSHQNGAVNRLNWPSGSERANGNNLGVYYDTGPVQPGLPAASWPVAMADWLRYRGVPSAQSGAAADAAGDGIPNLLKYGWNIDPLRGVHPGDPNGRPPGAEMTVIDGSPAFRFSWRRNRQAPDLDLAPEYSPSLAPGSWTRLPESHISETGRDPVTGDTLYEALVDPAGADKFFLRMRAQGGN